MSKASQQLMHKMNLYKVPLATCSSNRSCGSTQIVQQFCLEKSSINDDITRLRVQNSKPFHLAIVETELVPPHPDPHSLFGH